MPPNAAGSHSSRCVVCQTSVPKNPRYENYLCYTCHTKATDAHGRRLTFHTSSSGKFEARFKEDGSFAGEVTENHTVYVGASRVWAKKDERFGIVLTPFRGQSQPHGKCPVCHVLLDIVPRYPDYLCRSCVARAVDAKGRSLVFFNTHAGGGFLASYSDDGSTAHEVTETHTVYVGFLKVWADEARFGGIVLTPYREKRVGSSK